MAYMCQRHLFRETLHFNRPLQATAFEANRFNTDIRYIWQRELRIIGSNSYTAEDITKGMVGIAEGRYKLPEIRTFPLQELGEAERVMEERELFGKIIMVVE